MTTIGNKNKKYEDRLNNWINNCAVNDYSKLRSRLSNLQKISGTNADVVGYTIKQLKNRSLKKGADSNLKGDCHILSDHAFVRVLGKVLHLDVCQMKDKAYAALMEQKKIIPYYNSTKTKIVTVY